MKEKIPTLNQLPSGKRRPEKYGGERVTLLQEQMLQRFLTTTALSPQNFSLVIPSCMGVAARAMIDNTDVSFFTEPNYYEFNNIAQRLSNARDKLHASYGVETNQERSTGEQIFDYTYAAASIRRSVELSRQLQSLSISFHTQIQIADWILDSYKKHKDELRVYAQTVSKEATRSHSTETLQPIIDKVRNDFMETKLFTEHIGRIQNPEAQIFVMNKLFNPMVIIE